MTVSVPRLRVQDLTKRFGRLQAVDGVSFEVAPGEIVGLIGPNGAGKSLFLRLCHGLLKPTTGSIRWVGPDGKDPNFAQAMVFQRPVMLRRKARRVQNFKG